MKCEKSEWQHWYLPTLLYVPPSFCLHFKMEEYDLVELGEDEIISAGTQIAVKGLYENLGPLAKHLYHVISPEKYYYHHGVHLGNCEVIHLHGQNKNDAKVRRCTMEEFCSRGEVDGRMYKAVYRNEAAVSSVYETLARANEVLTSPEKWRKYDTISNNCETFATWLKTGKGFSIQASDAVSYGIGTFIGLAALPVLVTLIYIYVLQKKK